MAMSQSALSELLDAICAGGSIDVMREAMAVVLQELIELVGRARRGWRPEQATGASAQPIGQPRLPCGAAGQQQRPSIALTMALPESL